MSVLAPGTPQAALEVRFIVVVKCVYFFLKGGNGGWVGGRSRLEVHFTVVADCVVFVGVEDGW
jgi:hypothetical protein